MKIVFAQGNPGDVYTLTRHNIGCYCIDAIAAAYDASFLPKPRFQSDIAEVQIEGEKVLLVKPTTYYNETGHAARLLIDFYKLQPEGDFLVIHDDLALPFGTLRTRLDGRDAGNNGIKSLNAHIGQQYARIRVGIYSPLRDMQHDADFVLGKFTKEEVSSLPTITEHATHFVQEFAQGIFQPTNIATL